MSDLEITFQAAPEEMWIEQLSAGARLSAARLLMRYEGADEEQLEDIFLQLEEKNITLDLSDLTLPAASGETAQRLLREQQMAKQGLQMSQLEQTDPLRLYLEELAQIPVCGDVTALAGELAKANATGAEAEELRERMVNLSLSRVVELAAEYAGRGVLLMDMIQEGNLGLWRAIDMFVGEGESFEAYRDGRIRFYLDKAVLLHAHVNGIGQKLRTAAEDYRSVDERLLGELGRNPSLEEMAQALHMSVEETAAVAKTVEAVRALNHTYQPEPEDMPQEEDQAVEDTAYFQMRQRIAELLSALSEEDAKLLTLRYGLEGGLPMDPRQTAEKMGMTAQQVVARETAALKKLRNN